MAASQNRKRQRAGEPPAKNAKTRSEAELEAWESWEYPPEFYDRLSKISLNISPSAGILSYTICPQDIARFARHGGPNLCNLRGYPYPPGDRLHPVAISASRSSQSRRTKYTNPASTFPTSATMEIKTTPYNRDFDLHLTKHLVHPVNSSQKPDLEEVIAAIAIQRRSLSPSQFSNGAFKAFKASNTQAKDEANVLANVIPAILGPSPANRFCARNTVFRNLEPLTDSTIVAPKPNIYYSARPEQLARPARNELASHIIPSTMLDKPMAPNFFIEVKGPDGKPAVAIRQARYDGAVRSRAMHSLQNYGIGEPQYDNKPYTFSSAYQDGILKLYAHYVTAPTTNGGRPEYHMTKICGFDMTNTRETCVEGMAALRNTIDLAEKYRGNFIRDANARASQMDIHS
ncbi:glyoxylate reductase [Fusarium albosuccineum]|uniref:Glyoxylate reductase n=1 Tax=Fusarium albosuccineum TaxID=1237068 RepID=A0A8H4PCC7_9HYPO|nr:glyoxylate reductase [Fusarium albosuccineum]